MGKLDFLHWVESREHWVHLENHLRRQLRHREGPRRHLYGAEYTRYLDEIDQNYKEHIARPDFKPDAIMLSEKVRLEGRLYTTDKYWVWCQKIDRVFDGWIYGDNGDHDIVRKYPAPYEKGVFVDWTWAEDEEHYKNLISSLL